MDKYICNVPVIRTYQIEIEAETFEKAQDIILQANEEFLKEKDNNPIIYYPMFEEDFQMIWKGAITQLDWNEWEELPNGSFKRKEVNNES